MADWRRIPAQKHESIALTNPQSPRHVSRSARRGRPRCMKCFMQVDRPVGPTGGRFELGSYNAVDHRRLAKRRPRRFVEVGSYNAVGPSACCSSAAIHSWRPAFRSCLGVLRLGQECGSARLNAGACAQTRAAATTASAKHDDSAHVRLVAQLRYTIRDQNQAISVCNAEINRLRDELRSSARAAGQRRHRYSRTRQAPFRVAFQAAPWLVPPPALSRAPHPPVVASPCASMAAATTRCLRD